MIQMRVQELLNERKRTRYWLVKQMQTTYKTVNKLCDNTLTGLQLDTIEKLCSILECTPNDLFRFSNE
ncbi:MAG: helix-turn-helix transcriptional regulator [Clostridia bacterium]|nr:helix-turn-helix transcriptional regulator [Clostridia bacterium]